MNLVQKLSATLCCLLALSACVDKDVKENYRLKRIEYTLENPEDGQTERTITLKDQQFRNETDTEMEITIDPFPEDFIYITLTSNDPQSFDWKGCDEVRIPQPVVENGMVGWLYDKEREVPYRLGSNTYDSRYVEPMTCTIPPHHLLNVGGNVTYRRTQVTYQMTLKGEVTGEEKTATGTLVYDSPSGSSIYHAEAELP